SIQNSVRPISVPADLRGLKLRTSNNPIEIAAWRALGATPTPLAAPEVYTGLQTHLIDGTPFPLSSVVPFKLWEVEKYVSSSNHTWSGFTLVANADAWHRLPRDLQNVVSRNVETARLQSNADVEKIDASVEATLKSHEMVFNNVDREA